MKKKKFDKIIKPVTKGKKKTFSNWKALNGATEGSVVIYWASSSWFDSLEIRDGRVYAELDSDYEFGQRE